MTQVSFTPFELVSDEPYILKPEEYGTYQFTVEKFNVGVSKAGNKSIGLWLSFIAPNGSKAFAGGNITFPGEGISDPQTKHIMLANVSNFFKTIGHPELAGMGELRENQVIGSKGYAHIVTDTYNGNEKNKVKRFVIKREGAVKKAVNSVLETGPDPDSDIPF